MPFGLFQTIMKMLGVRILLIIAFPVVCGVQLQDGLIIQDNVIFQREKTLSSVRSFWKLGLITDLSPYGEGLQAAAQNYKALKEHVSNIIQEYSIRRNITFAQQFHNVYDEIVYVEGLVKELITQFVKVVGSPRNKRAVLPFVGDMISFLFGTPSSSDIDNIQHNIKLLNDNQGTLKHVVEKSLSLINNTRSEVQVNRDQLNVLSRMIRDTRIYINTTAKILEDEIIELERFTIRYMRIITTLERSRDILDKVKDTINRLLSNIDTLTIGRLTPNVIVPEHLKHMLIGVADAMPTNLQLPLNLDSDLKEYYKFLTSETFTINNRLVTIINIPLLDSKDTFDLYTITSVPIALQTVITPNGRENPIRARYKIEYPAMVVNSERTLMAVVEEQTLRKCLEHKYAFCNLQRAYYNTNNIRSCLWSLFSGQRITINCKKEILLNTEDPFIHQLTNDLWIIASGNEMKFNKVCYGDNHPKGIEIIIKSPLDIIAVEETCIAINDRLRIAAFKKYESEAWSLDPFPNVNLSINITGLNTWTPIASRLDALVDKAWPHDLTKLDKIDLDELTHELNQIQRIRQTEDHHYNTRMGSVIGAVIIITIICVIVGLLLKTRLPMMLLRKHRRNVDLVTAEAMPMRIFDPIPADQPAASATNADNIDARADVQRGSADRAHLSIFPK